MGTSAPAAGIAVTDVPSTCAATCHPSKHGNLYTKSPSAVIEKHWPAVARGRKFPHTSGKPVLHPRRHLGPAHPLQGPPPHPQSRPRSDEARLRNCSHTAPTARPPAAQLNEMRHIPSNHEMTSTHHPPARPGVSVKPLSIPLQDQTLPYGRRDRLAPGVQRNQRACML